MESKIAANIPPGGCWCRLHGVVSLLRHFKKISPFSKNCYPSVVCSVAAFGRVFVEEGAAINVRTGLAGTGHSEAVTG